MSSYSDICVCVGTHFLRVIPDEGLAAQNPAAVKRLLFCTGKVYYELTRERKARDMEGDVAIARIEQVTHTRARTHKADTLTICTI